MSEHKCFYANPPPAPNLKVNRFLKVDAPSDEVQKKEINKIKKLKKLAKGEITLVKAPPLDEDLQQMVNKIDSFDKNSNQKDYFKLLNSLTNTLHEEETTVIEEIPDFKGIDIFIKNKNNESILDKILTQQKIEKIERFLGRNKSQSNELAKELIKDMHTSTLYSEETINKEEFNIEKLQKIVQELITEKETA